MSGAAHRGNRGPGPRPLAVWSYVASSGAVPQIELRARFVPKMTVKQFHNALTLLTMSNYITITPGPRRGSGTVRATGKVPPGSEWPQGVERPTFPVARSAESLRQNLLDDDGDDDDGDDDDAIHERKKRPVVRMPAAPVGAFTSPQAGWPFSGKVIGHRAPTEPDPAAGPSYPKLNWRRPTAVVIDDHAEQEGDRSANAETVPPPMPERNTLSAPAAGPVSAPRASMFALYSDGSFLIDVPSAGSPVRLNHDETRTLFVYLDRLAGIGGFRLSDDEEDR